MDRRPDMDALAAAKRRQYVKKKKRERTIIVSLLLVTILAVWGLIFSILYHLWAPAAVPVETGTTEAQSAETTVRLPQETIATAPPKSQTVKLDNEDIHTGDLILVSTLLGRAYVFPKDESGLLTLYGNKSDSYRVSSSAIRLKTEVVRALDTMFDACFAETGCRDYQITQGYRTLDEQTSIYDDYQETYGAEQGALLAAMPGYSEHHSGLAFDMNVYTSSGTSYSLGTAGQTDPVYNWIYDNAAKYGFILRYPESKTSVTGIANEPWHFRYVGRGHAAYMTENGLTLEEYIALLRKYPEKGEHLTFAYDGTSYEMFYKKADAGAETAITLPADAEYTVSGDNDEGFVVTLISSDNTTGY